MLSTGPLTQNRVQIKTSSTFKNTAFLKSKHAWFFAFLKIATDADFWKSELRLLFCDLNVDMSNGYKLRKIDFSSRSWLQVIALQKAEVISVFSSKKS